jgi:hypothetical protein
MLDLRAEVRQSSGDVKARNVRGRCKKAQHLGTLDRGEYRQVAGATSTNVAQGDF